MKIKNKIKKIIKNAKVCNNNEICQVITLVENDFGFNKEILFKGTVKECYDFLDKNENALAVETLNGSLVLPF